MDKNISCEYCSTKLSSKYVLKTHLETNKVCLTLRNIIPDHKFSCDGCEELFIFKQKYERHIESCVPYNTKNAVKRLKEEHAKEVEKKYENPLKEIEEKYSNKMEQLQENAKRHLEEKEEIYMDRLHVCERHIEKLTKDNERHTEMLKKVYDEKTLLELECIRLKENYDTLFTESTERSNKYTDTLCWIIEKNLGNRQDYKEEKHTYTKTEDCTNTKEDCDYDISVQKMDISEYKFGIADFMVPIRSDGMINATALCKAGGKRLDHYKESPQTKAYLEELSLVTGIRVPKLFEANIGGSNGTWVHRKVGYHLAQWISPKFAVKVSSILDELFITGKVETDKQKMTEEVEELYTQKIMNLTKELETNKEQHKKLEIKHNSFMKNHRYFKFNETGPCLYIINSGINCGCNRIKFGISGTSKQEKLESFDDRLRSHRTIWPLLKVEFVIFLKQSVILEKNIKIIFEKEINPNGHEILEGIPTDVLIAQVKYLLNVLRIKEYKIMSDETLKKYNDYAETTHKEE